MSLLRSIALAALPLCAAPALAEEMVFSFTLKGITAAQLSIAGQVSSAGYSASGTLKSAGALGAVKKIRYDAKAQGAAGSRLTPTRYTERADTPKRQSQLVMSYQNGTPSSLTYTPARTGETPNLAAHKGSLDPLTALYTVLRDQPEASACQANFSTFDGKRSARVKLSKGALEGDQLSCKGSYTRVSGFSAREMAEKTRFEFTITYKRVGAVMRAQEIALDTIIGKGRLTRQ